MKKQTKTDIITVQALEKRAINKTWLEKKKYQRRKKIGQNKALAIKSSINLSGKKDSSHITYYIYSKKRHYAKDCLKQKNQQQI